MSCYIDIVGCTNNDDHNGIDKGDCPYCHIAELEQQLAKKDKQLFEENLQVKRLESQLSHYQGGVEVEGYVFANLNPTIPGREIAGITTMSETLVCLANQRVRVLVMKEAE